ncbi:hypothetical protein RYJ27_07350 [Microbacterium limosum]|uniref:Histidine kinase n=1 Tax=Microbacterium limosum TaxID=3079935 RepID=A0AAU0MDZ7_9MICO|nr:hypothetical protein [Microbacterium sp. Y20]WOQ68549.1 hypothetical protein RYJ27_07350 [Microbacterium sp. Y20]
MTVDNNGDAPPAAFESSGLARLRQNLPLAEGRITLSPGGDLGGARLRATLTV